MKAFFKTYKIYICLFVALWLSVAVVQYWVILPIRQDNNRQKKEVKRLENENEVIKLERKKAEALIVLKDKKIKKLEALEQYYKDKASQNIIIYEKQKTDYIGRPVADRIRVFSKLANEQ